jgi:hypothetical protein
MKRRRNRAQRLRTAVELLPRHTREAMLRGVDSNEIIVGAYTDRDGGVCPMLAAHRNGGRTSFASFARAWDDFTRARRPRRATRREIQILRTYLEMSLLSDDTQGTTLTAAVNEVRRARRDSAERAAAGEPQPRLGVVEATLAATRHLEVTPAEPYGEPTDSPGRVKTISGT